MFICDRCKKETWEPEKCMCCLKRICRACVKSMKKLHKLERIAICKDCWGKMGERAKFKTAK